MSPDDHAGRHIQEILDTLEPRLRAKYMAGQKEHGGRLWRKNVMPFMIEEIVDFVVYSHQLEEQIEKTKALLRWAIRIDDVEYVKEYVKKALNVLTIGNEEGIPEEEL